MKKLLLVLLLVAAHARSLAQTWQDTAAVIETIFARYRPPNPGCQLAISRKGQLLFSRAWGLADLEHHVALTTDSRIEAGSVAKQFTAAAILLLQQQGQLSLQDEVRNYIPELPDYGTPITLRHLLQHTSGLKDWGSLMAFSDWPRGTKTYSNQEVLAILSRQPTLNHAPGAEHFYSNSNYVLLALIVERVSGRSLADFTRAALFEPAGMTHTEWRTSLTKLVAGRAIAYGKNEEGYFTDMPRETVYGNGGLLTTAEDLGRWNTYYTSGQLGDPSLLAEQLSTTPLENGRPNPYGAGLRIGAIRGWNVISHDGATAAYRANLEYYPALGLSIAWLANTAEFDGLADGTAELRTLLLTNRASPPVNLQPDTITLTTEKLTPYVGWYQETRTGQGLLLSVQDGKLVNNRGGSYLPLTENEFMVGATRVEMQAGRRPRLVYREAGDTIRYEAAKPAIKQARWGNAYTGDYYSGEVEAKLRVSLQEGTLVIHRYPNLEYRLRPTYRDAFTIVDSSVIVGFERGKRGRITGLQFTSARVRKVTFQKFRYNRKSAPTALPRPRKR